MMVVQFLLGGFLSCCKQHPFFLKYSLLRTSILRPSPLGRQVYICATKSALKLKKIHPFHVLLFVAGVLLLLTPIMLFIPKEGWDLGGYKLNFLTQNSFLHPTKQEKKDISRIVSKVDTLSIQTPDTLIKHENSSTGSLGAPMGGNLSTESATSIHLNELALYKLNNFFEKMTATARERNKIHILHYGDSQIEGDRMTAYIRERIQNQFGGYGAGLIPAMNVYITGTFNQRYSDNFRRYTCFGGDKLKSRRYGVMGSAARFTPEMDSARMSNETSIKEGWIELETGKLAYPRAKQYSLVKMFYTSCYRPCTLKVFQGEKLVHEDSLIVDGRAHTVELSFASTPAKLRFVLSATVSPTITHFSLEGDYGVQVSNIGLRGSSGTIFGAMDQQLTSKQMHELNTELVIMQFGGNAVPFFKDSSAVRNYVASFKSQLMTIYRLRPSTSLLVIGPSDMSRLENGTFVTYPLLPYCVAMMRKAALEVGAGYYDMYAAMGGKNSMPSWVEQGLAGRDYIHFSVKGASIASQLFFEAFAAQYAKWAKPSI